MGGIPLREYRHEYTCTTLYLAHAIQAYLTSKCVAWRKDLKKIEANSNAKLSYDIITL